MSDGYDTIRYETDGEIASVILDRPDRLNAWTPHMAEELADAIGRANDDRAIGAIIIRGEGRGFCSGADMDAVFQTRIDGTDPGADTAGGSGGMPSGIDWVGLMRKSKPIVAAIHGAAVGIGITMVLPADVIVATSDAKIGVVFIKVGLVPELASTQFLVQRVGWGAASELCLAGDIVRGDEAGRIGLVDHVVDDHDALLVRANELAGAFAANPTPQALMIKRLLTENAASTDLHAVQRLESELLRECWATPEHAEAVAAFTEKRKPVFR
ncbi:MAG: enoyl-CoA hydratase/isomerase family protein [Ilumatobacteraceae bacterium]|nr:enoyl-CoA hydratase/isomerase family protein [Ilumatobacteraceae bacterium]